MASVANAFRAAIIHPTVPRRPRYSTGWWAWLLQRLSGIVLLAYLVLHIGVISSAQLGADAFNSVLGFVQTPFFAYLDLALIAIVIYHGANGVRVVMLDAGIGARYQTAMVWAALFFTIAGTAVAAYVGRPLFLVG